MSIVVTKVQRRLKASNKNWLAIVCGATGSGKSYAALRLAEMIDPTFDVERVVFSAEEFMKLLNNDIKKGQMIIWDEAGVGIPAREWYSISNKAINYVFQVFRHMNVGVILTTPSFDYIDSQTRKLFHNYIETVGIDTSTNEVMTKFMNVTFNPRFGKEYFQYPRIGGKCIKRLNIGLPSKPLRKAYETKKSEFSSVLRKGVEKDLKQVKDKTEKLRLSDNDIQEELAKMKEKGERPTLADVQRLFGVGKDRASFNLYTIFPKKRKMWEGDTNE